MDNFLDTYHLLKLNQEQISNLNRLITPCEIEAVVKICLTGFQRKMSLFLKFFPQTRNRGNTAQSILLDHMATGTETRKGPSKRITEQFPS